MIAATILFDLEGTLINSLHVVHLYRSSVLALHGRAKFSLDTVNSFDGGGAASWLVRH